MAAEPLDILAFAAHPDDAEWGCGGSLLLAADQGLRTAVADLTAGERSSRGTPERRAQEVEEASRRLGLVERYALGLPDSELTADPAQRQSVIALLRATRPRIVLAPYFSDRHPDHAAAGRLVEEACFYAGAAKVGQGVPFRPERLYFYMMHHPFDPSFVVDVEPVWERKMAAVAAYASQFGEELEETPTALSGSFFPRFLQARAITYGAMIGAAYGEPFYARGPLAAAGLPGLEVRRPAAGTLPYRVY